MVDGADTAVSDRDSKTRSQAKSNRSIGNEGDIRFGVYIYICSSEHMKPKVNIFDGKKKNAISTSGIYIYMYIYIYIYIYSKKVEQA